MSVDLQPRTTPTAPTARRPSRRLFEERHAERDLVLAIAIALTCVLAMAVAFIVVARG